MDKKDIRRIRSLLTGGLSNLFPNDSDEQNEPPRSDKEDKQKEDGESKR